MDRLPSSSSSTTSILERQGRWSPRTWTTKSSGAAKTGGVYCSLNHGLPAHFILHPSYTYHSSKWDIIAWRTTICDISQSFIDPRPAVECIYIVCLYTCSTFKLSSSKAPAIYWGHQQADPLHPSGRPCMGKTLCQSAYSAPVALECAGSWSL